MGGEVITLDVDREKVRFSNPDKVYFPELATTELYGKRLRGSNDRAAFRSGSGSTRRRGREARCSDNHPM